MIYKIRPVDNDSAFFKGSFKTKIFKLKTIQRIVRRWVNLLRNTQESKPPLFIDFPDLYLEQISMKLS